jgi:hypothetical protein
MSPEPAVDWSSLSDDEVETVLGVLGGAIEDD